MISLSRRTFLAGSAALALGACGSSKGSGGVASGTAVVRFFDDGFTIPGRQRLPLGLRDKNAALLLDGPATLTARLFDNAGTAVGRPLTAAKSNDPLIPRPFWAFSTAIEQPGIFRLDVSAGSKKIDEVNFTVSAPSAVVIPKPGEALPALATPVTGNAQGVDPICTRNPMCPFHTVSLDDALKLGKPVALLIATPAHCKTAVCGPMVDLLVAQQPMFGDKITLIHAEVYADDGATAPAPIIAKYNLDFEPTIYFVDPKGLVVNRIDVLWQTSELVTALGGLVS